jgi:predicted branched-subunit amino acid permease
MLLCLLVFQLRDRVHLMVAVISGIAAVAVALLLPGNAYVMIASIFAATVGLVLRKRHPATREEGK